MQVTSKKTSFMLLKGNKNKVANIIIIMYKLIVRPNMESCVQFTKKINIQKNLIKTKSGNGEGEEDIGQNDFWVGAPPLRRKWTAFGALFSV